MKYNLSTEFDRQTFLTKAKALADKGACVELTEMTSRSLSQNAYLHLLIGIVAMWSGVSVEYAKEEYFKRIANKDLFVINRQDKVKGETVQMLRSTSALTKEEMSTAIDRFKKWAAQYEIYLPNPGDNELAKQAEIEIYRYQRVWDIQ